MPTIAIHLPDDPATLDLSGSPHDLPVDIYEAALDLYAVHVEESRNPRAAVLATARLATDAARMQGWPKDKAALFGDIVARLAQEICDDALRAVD